MVLSANLSAQPVGLYSLSALSVVVLSKKEGWLACASTVLLVLSCVARAVLAAPAPDECPEAPKPKPKPRRNRLRADAEVYVPRRVSEEQVQIYRDLLSANVEQSPAPEETSAFTPPPGLAPPKLDQLPVQQWWASKAPSERIASAAEARALLGRLMEGAKATRKPAGGRIVAGVRETARAVAHDRAAAVMVAADLPWADGQLVEPKMQAVVEAAHAKGVPVVVGLCRAELGQTISKDVAAAVVAILDVSGAEDAFFRLLNSAENPTPAPAA